MIKQLWNCIPYKLRFALELIGGTILALGFIASMYMFCNTSNITFFRHPPFDQNAESDFKKKFEYSKK